MFQHQIKLSLLAVLAACMLALSGCGGGGGGGTPTTPEMPMPVSVDLAGVAADAVEAGTAEIAAGASTDIGEVTFTCAVGGADCTVTVTVDADGNASAEATGGTVTAANSAGYDTRIAVAETKAAGTLETAIGVEARQTTDDGAGGSGATNDHTIAITRDRMATKVAITVDGAVDGDPEFAQAMDMGDGRTMHVLTNEADDDGNVVEEVVVVSTDIEEPTATAFATVHPFNTNPVDSSATPVVNQSLTIATADLSMLATTGISATGAGTITVLAAVDDDPATEADETVAAFETAATFDDASGTLKCGGAADCTVTLGVDGKLTAVTGGWFFTPEADATVDVADGDYLHYGFWLEKTTDADGVLTYDEVQTFAGSSIAASGDIAAVTGSAKYKGGATGVYVRNTYKPEDGTIATATSGDFTADASLTATFGQVNDADGDGTIAPNLLNTLTGIINNFNLSGGEENEWSVALKGDITAADGDASGSANGGGAAGEFSATFHGPVAEVESVIPHPHTVVGEFDANFGNGAVAGAFGARKE